jgi:hypothetical protein
LQQLLLQLCLLLVLLLLYHLLPLQAQLLLLVLQMLHLLLHPIRLQQRQLRQPLTHQEMWRLWQLRAKHIDPVAFFFFLCLCCPSPRHDFWIPPILRRTQYCAVVLVPHT